MKRKYVEILLIFLPSICWLTDQNAQNQYDLADILSYPFPNELVSAKKSQRMVWCMNEEGHRNIYAAEAPSFQPRRLTNYQHDDGQEISQVQISDDGIWVVYVRGGDFGSNWNDDKPVNPTFQPIMEKVAIWSIPFNGSEPTRIDEGISPAISPAGDKVAYIKDDQIYLASLGGSAKTTKIIEGHGRQSDLNWAPDGSMLAFVSNRNDHSFIGIYRDSLTPLNWIDPSFHHDFSPRWSSDSKNIVFVRQNGSGGEQDSLLASVPDPYALVTFNLTNYESKVIWNSPNTMRGSLPSTHGGVNLHWAKHQIIFLSYHDGWPHLFSISPDGGQPRCLTDGNYMVEYVSLKSDGGKILASANTGPEEADIDRRHILEIDLGENRTQVRTPGTGNEWAPCYISDSDNFAYISATAQQPPLVAVSRTNQSQPIQITRSLVPSTFPQSNLVTPQQVIFNAPDGTSIHATLFRPEGLDEKIPCVVYVHGGPPRQMLLGWHYSSYYANAYALNQYLTSQGFAVLSVNYRLGIGYGYEFHRPPNGGVRGASEYQDIKAAGEWLAKQDFCDAQHIGIYGGSYGGYLTAMALARDSKLFVAGVDIHGVHDRTVNRTASYLFPDRYEKAPDAEAFREIAWQSSPVSSVDGWESPVLIIHADDDRNVPFSQSTDLVQRLRKKQIDLETMVIVDDTHHFMLHANQLKVNRAVSDFFIRKLKRSR